MKPTKQRPASATACAGRAAREAAARPPSAPLPRVRFAVRGSREGVVKRTAEPASDGSPAGRDQEHRAMSGHDAELALFRRGVNCAALLESVVPGWKLDPKETTQRALKYWRDDGAILIVNHDGRGWWDPWGTAKGDVFDLVQHLDPRLNFGQSARSCAASWASRRAFPRRYGRRREGTLTVCCRNGGVAVRRSHRARRDDRGGDVWRPTAVAGRPGREGRPGYPWAISVRLPPPAAQARYCEGCRPRDPPATSRCVPALPGASAPPHRPQPRPAERPRLRLEHERHPVVDRRELLRRRRRHDREGQRAVSD